MGTENQIEINPVKSECLRTLDLKRNTFCLMKVSQV